MANFIDPDDKPQPGIRFRDPDSKESPKREFSPMQRRMGLGGPNSTVDPITPILEMPYAAGGKVTDIASGMGASPEVAAGAGYLTNVGLQAATLPFGGPAKSAKPVMEAGARALMQSAAKPTLEQLRTGKAARAIDTMLKDGYNPTKGGVEKMKAAIASLNDEISTTIGNSTATVDKGKVAAYLDDALKKFEMQVTPGSDTKAIEAAWTEFLNHPMLVGKDQIPVQLAQQMKQGTYKALGDKSYGELKGASTEAQKTLARGLKEEIGKAHPEVAAMNLKESELINALKVAERRALVDANKNPVGLGPLAGHPGWMAAFLADRSALVKAMAARGLYAGSEQIPLTAARAAIAAGASQAGMPSDPYLRGILYGE
jgi:hypothetical protein